MDFLKALALGADLLKALQLLKSSNDQVCESSDALRGEIKELRGIVNDLRSKIEGDDDKEAHHVG
jgi:phage shock protein A